MDKKTLLGLVVAAAMGSATAYAGDMTYSYSQNDQYMLWGAKLSQSYDLAIQLPGSAFVGNEITSIMVPVLESPNHSDYKVWLTTELKLETVEGKKVNVPDVLTADVEPQGFADQVGYIVYDLPEGYTITEKGVYVGYSLTVDRLDSDLDRYPILGTKPGADDAFWVHSSKTYRNWQDRSTEIDLSLPIRVTMTGDFSADAVTIDPIDNFYASAGKESTRTVTIHNAGTSPVASVEYTVTSGDVKTEGLCELPSPIPAVYNRAADIQVTFPAMTEGEHVCEVEITKVNGQANGRTAKTSVTAKVMDKVPVKRPLMEEFTGTWCGWCPRGWVAMEKMHEFYPDFVCISYHNGDAMQLAVNYPDMASGFPTSFMDRKIECDPYYGVPETPMGIEQTWKEMSQEFAPAEVEVSADLDGTTVRVTSDAIWASTADDGEYRMAYVLTGDKMSDAKWLQSNYYTRYTAEEGGPYMENFCKGGVWGYSSVPLLEFSDVALLSTPTAGIEGSVPNLNRGDHNEYSYSFDLTENPLYEKAQDLHVVAILVKSKGRYGEVVNCNIATVNSYNAIAGVSADAEISSVRYYDLSGRELRDSREVKGVAIKSVKYTDGRTVNSKEIR